MTIVSLISLISCMISPWTFLAFIIMFLSLCLKVVILKNLILRSPYWSHVILDFYLYLVSSLSKVLFKLHNTSFSSYMSSFGNPVVSIFTLNSIILIFIISFFSSSLPNTSQFQILICFFTCCSFFSTIIILVS